MHHDYVHYHCPEGHEKAQFLQLEDEKWYCAMCWFNDKHKAPMTKCTPETCD